MLRNVAALEQGSHLKESGGGILQMNQIHEAFRIAQVQWRGVRTCPGEVRHELRTSIVLTIYIRECQPDGGDVIGVDVKPQHRLKCLSRRRVQVEGAEC